MYKNKHNSNSSKYKQEHIKDLKKSNSAHSLVGYLGCKINTSWQNIDNFINLIIALYSIYKTNLTDVYIWNNNQRQQATIIKFHNRIQSYLDIISNKFSIVNYVAISDISTIDDTINSLIDLNNINEVSSILQLIELLKNNNQHIYINLREEKAKIRIELSNIYESVKCNNIYLIDPVYLNKLNINMLNAMIQLNYMIYS